MAQTPADNEDPEVLSHRLMPAKTRAGTTVNLGAGVVTGGRIALINHSPDGVAVLSADATSDYMGLLRQAMAEAVARRAAP
jgi:hypothetical protein